MHNQGNLRLVLNSRLWTQMKVQRANHKNLQITATDLEGNGIKVFLIQVSYRFQWWGGQPTNTIISFLQLLIPFLHFCYNHLHDWQRNQPLTMVIDSVMWPNIYLNWHQSQYESGGPHSKTFRCYYLSFPLLLQSCQQAYEFPATTLSKWLLGGQQNLNLPLNAVTQIEEALWAQQRSQWGMEKHRASMLQPVQQQIPILNMRKSPGKRMEAQSGCSLQQECLTSNTRYRHKRAAPNKAFFPPPPASGFFHGWRPGGLEKIWVHKRYWSS